MAIKYFQAPDIEQKAVDICRTSGINKDFSRIHFIRSTGSKSNTTLARCHSTPRAIQTALSIKAHYVIEIVSENFDKLSEDEKVKTIIHELLHIPESMRGGFRHHDFVCRKNVENVYKNYLAGHDK